MIQTCGAAEKTNRTKQAKSSFSFCKIPFGFSSRGYIDRNRGVLIAIVSTVFSATVLSISSSPAVHGAEKKVMGAVVFANKYLPAGKIVCWSDVERRVVERKIIPGKVIGSALEIVGYKTKTSIQKEEMISSLSIDFKAKLNNLEAKRSKAEFEKAARFCTDPYDLIFLKFRRAKYLSSCPK